MINPEQLYEEHKALICQKAIQIHRSFGMPYEECVSEGNIIFCDTLRLYDESKSKFSTFLFIRLSHGLLQFTKRWHKQIPQYYEEIETLPDRLHPVEEYWVAEFWNKVRALSEEAEAVVICLTEGPEEIYIAIQTKPPKMVRGAVVKYLRKEKLWSWPKIWQVFREIKQWIRKGDNL